MTHQDFPRHELPPVRHEQMRDLMVEQAQTHPSRRPLRPRSARVIAPSGPARSDSPRFAVAATAVAVVLAVVAVGAGGRLIRERPDRPVVAPVASPSPSLRPTSTPSPAPKPTGIASATPTASHPVVPANGSDLLGRSISAARNRPLMALSQDTPWVQLFSTSGPTPQRIARFDALGQWTASLALNPAGTLLATSGDEGTVRIWDLSTPSSPRLAQTLTHSTMYVPDLEFSPDGTYLATAGYDNQARVWRVSGTSLTSWTALPADTDVMGVAFDPTGRYLATATYDRVTLWDLQASTRGAVRLGGFPISTPGHVNLTFSPDGRTLAVATGNVTLWDVADLRAPVRGKVLRQAGWVTAFAHQTPALATMTRAGKVSLWRVTDARQAILLGRPTVNGSTASDDRSLAFGADDTTLAVTAIAAHDVTVSEVPVPAA